MQLLTDVAEEENSSSPLPVVDLDCRVVAVAAAVFSVSSVDDFSRPRCPLQLPPQLLSGRSVKNLVALGIVAKKA
jgi:hypothetical protein